MPEPLRHELQSKTLRVRKRGGNWRAHRFRYGLTTRFP